MPKVTVIYPMYNVEKYVADSLKSVLNQTYKDFEIVAVNDGSTDETLEVFNSVMDECNKGIMFTLVNTANSGLSEARNVAMRAAKGEWLVFVDSDDVIHPKYLETLISDSEKLNADLVIASYKTVSKENLFEFEDIYSGSLIKKEELMRLMFSRSKFVPYCGCFLVKRNTLLENNIEFNKDVRFSVDQAFMWQVVDVANRIAINYSKIYNYYIRPNSIMTSSKINQICSGVDHYTSVIKSLKNLPFDSNDLINRWKMGILHSAAKLSDFSQFKTVREKIDLKYLNSLNIPLLKIKLFAITGILSEHLLFKIFRRY